VGIPEELFVTCEYIFTHEKHPIFHTKLWVIFVKELCINSTS